MNQPLTIHPVANIFPMMSAEEYEAFKEDIRANGQHDPIWLYKDQIIDGRNRYKACCDLDLEPVFREWNGEGSLINFVVSLNLHRRHLSSSQRAVIALEIEKQLSAEARERQLATLKQGDQKPDTQKIAERETGESREQAAALAGTNRQYVSDAKRLEKEAPELLEKVRSGEMSIPEAKAAAGLTPKPSPLPHLSLGYYVYTSPRIGIAHSCPPGKRVTDCDEYVGTHLSLVPQPQVNYTYCEVCAANRAKLTVPTTPASVVDQDGVPAGQVRLADGSTVSTQNDLDETPKKWHVLSGYGQPQEDPQDQPDPEAASTPNPIKYLHSSKSNEWYTPPKYLVAARELMGVIDLDPASCATANEQVQASKFYSIEDNGLSLEWRGKVWLNPPYGNTDQGSSQAVWSKRLIAEYHAGNVTEAVLLINAVPDRRWFDALWDFPICFCRRRIRFYSPTTTVEEGRPTHPSALVYFGTNPQRFASIFSQFGRIVVPQGAFSAVLEATGD